MTYYLIKTINSSLTYIEVAYLKSIWECSQTQL